MKTKNILRLALSAFCSAGTLTCLDSGCQQLIQDSVRDGIFNYVTGSLSQTTLDPDLVTDLFLDFFTEGLEGLGSRGFL